MVVAVSYYFRVPMVVHTTLPPIFNNVSMSRLNAERQLDRPEGIVMYLYRILEMTFSNE